MDARTEFREAARARALAEGFELARFTTAEPLGASVERRWERWRRRAVAGAMTYLLRERPRRTHPRDVLPDARTALVVAAAYFDGDHPPPPEGEGVAGKIARYAWGRDYHGVLRRRLERVGDWIEREARRRGLAEAVARRACVDSAPLDERALAVRAGLGFFGKNTLLLHPELGSWMLLGVLLLSLDLPPDPPLRGATASCGSCRRCLEACPTGAIAAPYTLDPTRCLSYLTIEQRGPIPEALASRMEGWAFGCDRCQEVCPFNAAPPRRRLPELATAAGMGPYVSQRRLAATPTGKGFLRRWGETALARAGLRGLRRSLEALACTRGR